MGAGRADIVGSATQTRSNLEVLSAMHTVVTEYLTRVSWGPTCRQGCHRHSRGRGSSINTPARAARLSVRKHHVLARVPTATCEVGGGGGGGVNSGRCVCLNRRQVGNKYNSMSVICQKYSLKKVEGSWDEQIVFFTLPDIHLRVIRTKEAGHGGRQPS